VADSSDENEEITKRSGMKRRDGQEKAKKMPNKRKLEERPHGDGNDECLQRLKEIQALLRESFHESGQKDQLESTYQKINISVD